MTEDSVTTRRCPACNGTGYNPGDHDCAECNGTGKLSQREYEALIPSAKSVTTLQEQADKLRDTLRAIAIEPGKRDISKAAIREWAMEAADKYDAAMKVMK